MLRGLIELRKTAKLSLQVTPFTLYSFIPNEPTLLSLILPNVCLLISHQLCRTSSKESCSASEHCVVSYEEANQFKVKFLCGCLTFWLCASSQYCTVCIPKDNSASHFECNSTVEKWAWIGTAEQLNE